MLELIAICLVIWVCLMFIMGSGAGKQVEPVPESDAAQTFKGLMPRHKKAIKEQGLTILDFTCTNCQQVSTCPSAYDLYNTNGDCLEEK